MGESIKYYGKRRSIVRRIGSLLPIKPPPKVYISVTPLHSMSSSMIDDDRSNDFSDHNGLGLGRYSSFQLHNSIQYPFLVVYYYIKSIYLFLFKTFILADFINSPNNVLNNV
jgi:hypothetical protein